MAGPARPPRSALRQIARGSAWMVAARWSIRGMGLINTVVLARLLAPSDFGMVAMAMVAQEFIRVFAETGGLDLAVIRHPSPTAEHYDTAWTMSVCAGVVTALALVAIAPVAEWYFHEPRVVRLIWFLSLAPLIVGAALLKQETYESISRDRDRDPHATGRTAVIVGAGAVSAGSTHRWFGTA